MPHIFKHDDHYFRVDVVEVSAGETSARSAYVCWCSEAFKELEATPKQALTRFIAGPSVATYEDARRHAHDWIKATWDRQKAARPTRAPEVLSVIYTVWLFKGETTTGFDFEEFEDAQGFAKEAEKSLEITKILIKNNESPQYLTSWEKQK